MAQRGLEESALSHAASIPGPTNRCATKGNLSDASCSLEMTDGRLHQRSLLAVVRSEPGSESFDRLACTFSSCEHNSARLQDETRPSCACAAQTPLLWKTEVHINALLAAGAHPSSPLLVPGLYSSKGCHRIDLGLTLKFNMQYLGK